MASSTTTTEDPMRKKCIFCKICDEEPEKIIDQNDELTIIKDIRPAAKYHYLILTKKHIKDVNSLSADDISLVERMVAFGKSHVSDVDESKFRMGFHWPPFHAVAHLHLHIIAPESDMGLIAKGMFMKNSYWFVSPETTIDVLKKRISKI